MLNVVHPLLIHWMRKLRNTDSLKEENTSIVFGCTEAQRDSNNDQRARKAGVASPADVSPNTPRADEAD